MKEEETTYHVPVLLKESVDAMNISPDGTYVDVTFGGGGHSREILSRLGDGGRLLGFDQDEDAERNIVNDPHFTFVRSNFRYLHNFLRYHDIGEVDAILADLGVSSHHFDDSERGFSFRFDGKLDMRMNKRAGITAADVVNTYEEERLADIFYLYGELKNSRKLVRETGSRKRFARLTLSQNNRLAECVCWNDYYMEHRTEIQSLKDRVVILTAVIRYSDYNGCNTLQTYKNSLLFIQS